MEFHKKIINEKLLSFIWKHGLLNTELKDTNGRSIKILKPGELNTNSGPDFFAAKLKYDNMVWSGNVEIHTKSSDWFAHKHHQNQAYDNIIAHVVYKNDKIISKLEENNIPTIQLSEFIDKSIINKYLKLYNNKSSWVPCDNIIVKNKTLKSNLFLDRLTITRLERKSIQIIKTLKYFKGDWNQAFIAHLFRAFGTKVNADSFFELGKITPIHLLSRTKNIIEIEALLFGTSGLLDEAIVDNSYIKELKNNFSVLRLKNNYQVLKATSFKFMRMRPSNFPTIKISQLSNLLATLDRTNLIQLLYEANINSLLNKLNVTTSEYWNNHSKFNTETKLSTKLLGKDIKNTILINFIIPFKFAYGKNTGQDNLVENAIKMFEAIGPESNSIITKWSHRNLNAVNAMESQALIELKTQYCDKKRCLECDLGSNYLSYD